MLLRDVHNMMVTAMRSLALCVVCGLFALPAAAADGRFEVLSATTRVKDDIWFVDARVNLELSDDAVEALQSGVTLRIAFQYEIRSRRRFWVDRLVDSRQQSFELQYLSLSQRYVVRDVSDNTVNSYATLFSALRYLGQIRDYRLTADVPADDAETYSFSLRAVLDWEQLPGPLAVLAFWRGDFSLESDWYRWTPN